MDDNKAPCSECGDIIPRAEFDSHAGFCSDCHAEHADLARSLLEDWDLNECCGVELTTDQLTKILAMGRYVEALVNAAGEAVARIEAEKRRAARPRLHVPK